MTPALKASSHDQRPAFAVLPGDVPLPQGLRMLGRLDRFDLAVPVAARLGAEVLVLSQRLVDAERGWDAVRSLRQESGVEVWVFADGPSTTRSSWADVAAIVIEADEPRAGAAHSPREVRAPEHVPATAKRVVILGAKGGTGKTFLAANLAAAVATRGSRVSLVDLDFESGDLALRLGLEPSIDLASAVQSDGASWPAARRDPILSLWAAPARPELACLADEHTVHRILANAAAEHDVCLVDTPSDPDQDHIYSALEGADLALMVTTLNPGAVRQCRVMVELIKRLNYPVHDRLLLVLNKVRRRSLMTPGAACDLIGLEAVACLPDVPALADAESYYGQPSILRCRRGPLVKAMTMLALRVRPEAEWPVPNGRPRGLSLRPRAVASSARRWAVR